MNELHAVVSVPKSTRKAALKFVLLVGVMSFFADFTYEGARSITGPFMAMLGANGAIVGIVAGLGELLGYGLRLVSGSLSEKTQKFWPITLFGYLIQMAAVPLLAFAGSWQMAALLIIVERVGKAIRNPPRDVMLSHAAKEMGYGWGFGVHEALDQSGALFGPLVVAAVLAHQGNYRMGFAVLVIPAVITYSVLIVARVMYPRPEDLEADVPDVHAKGLPRIFWIYLAGAALVAAGFADFQLIAYHFEKADAVNISGFRSRIRLRWPSAARIAAFRPHVRSDWHWHTDPPDVGLSRVRAFGISRRLLAGDCGISALGTRHGGARIHRAGGGRHHGASSATPVCIRSVHGRLWRGLVHWQRADGRAIRFFYHRRCDFLCRTAAGGGADFSEGADYGARETPPLS